MRINRPTLKLSMAKVGDTIKLVGDPRVFTIVKNGPISGYVKLDNRGKEVLASGSSPIILIASALDTEAVIE